MPYIKIGDGRREALQKGESALIAGELNYQIFYYYKHRFFSEIFKNRNLSDSEIIDLDFERVKVFVDNFLGNNRNYQKYNDMTGALLRCYREIKRRLNEEAITLLYILDSYDNEIASYEDEKCLENGDVE